MINWKMILTQDYNSFLFKYMIMFHDFLLLILILLTSLIFYVFFMIIFSKYFNYLFIKTQLIEIIWTVIPLMLIFMVAIPSIKILYMTEEIYTPSVTIKINGHQWFWTYYYPEYDKIEYDSFMIKHLNEKDLMRLLDVDNFMVIPMEMMVRLMISSQDVIHSWTIPSLGIKVDSVPGRINQTFINAFRPTIMFGQCSEICGINHSFMPIVVETTEYINFKVWTMYLADYF